MKVLFLASGNGGTMKFIQQAIETLNLDFEIVACISDRECGAVEYSANSGIPTKIFTPWRERIDEIVEAICTYSPDIVVTNIYKILPYKIFSCCNARFINLHYSLLPAFGGVIGFKTLELAKECNARIIGSTCHYVNEFVDGGKIISQSAITVDWDNEKLIDIGDRVFRSACLTILNGMLSITNISIGETNSSEILFSPKLRFDASVFIEDFWKKIKSL